jgi:hypothetical protein
MITFVPGRIWIEERPQRFFGMPMGTRMTVIKLAAGGLFVHSPVTPDAAVETLIAREGEVRFVIAPIISTSRPSWPPIRKPSCGSSRSW